MSDEIFQKWLAGDCVCCQGELDNYVGSSDSDPNWEVVFSPMIIGEIKPEPDSAAGVEYVKVCGRCAAMRHLDPEVVPGVRDALIASIQSRDDTALYEAIGFFRWSDGNYRSWPEDEVIIPIAIIIPTRSGEGNLGDKGTGSGEEADGDVQ